MDVDGTDTAQKLAILAHLAFGARVHWRDIPRQGIDALDAADLMYARELGYRIKLLAVAELVNGDLELHVSPTLVQLRHAAGRSAQRLQRHLRRRRRRGTGVFPRPGGRSDADRFGRGRRFDRYRGRPHRDHLPHARTVVAARGPGRAREHDRVAGRFYMRFNVEDRPGVMADIAGVLGRHGISIASVIQHEAAESSATSCPW